MTAIVFACVPILGMVNLDYEERIVVLSFAFLELVETHSTTTEENRRISFDHAWRIYFNSIFFLILKC